MKIPWELAITDIGAGFGSQCILNANLAEKMERNGVTRPERILTSLGIETRYCALTSENHDALVQKSIENLLSASVLSTANLIVACTQTDYVTIPNLARRTATKLGLSSCSHIIQIQSGCTGFVEAMSLANTQICHYGWKNAVIITVDLFSSLINENDWTNSLLFSDGAATIILYRQPQKFAIFESFHFDNRGCLNLDLRIPDYSMDGLSTFNFTALEVEKAVQKLSEELFEERIEVSQVFLHQASLQVIEIVKNSISKFFPTAEIPCNIIQRGNLNSSSIPVLIYDNLMSIGCSDMTKYSVIIGFGAGLSVTYLAVPNTTFNRDCQMHLILGLNSSIGRALLTLHKDERIFGTYNNAFPDRLPSNLNFEVITKVDMSRIDQVQWLSNHAKLNNIKKITWLVGKVGFKKFARYTPEEIISEYMINVLGITVLLNRLFARKAIAANASICLVSTAATVNPGRGQSIYSSSKAALNLLAIVITNENKAKNIKCYALCPKFFMSPSTDYLAPFVNEKYSEQKICAIDVAKRINELHDASDFQGNIHEL